MVSSLMFPTEFPATRVEEPCLQHTLDTKCPASSSLVSPVMGSTARNLCDVMGTGNPLWYTYTCTAQQRQHRQGMQGVRRALGLARKRPSTLDQGAAGYCMLVHESYLLAGWATINSQARSIGQAAEVHSASTRTELFSEPHAM